jgi:ornithine carbamoyltransferase
LKGKDLLVFDELSSSDVTLILLLAQLFKRTRGGRAHRDLLRSHTLALIFQKQSTRTRVSFEVAMRELGGDAISLSSAELQLGRGETISDTARVLSRYVHALMARVYVHHDVEELARAASVPVINGLSDRYHPVQILADLLTLQERRKKSTKQQRQLLAGLRVAWVGDGNNVCRSWLYGAALTGIDLTVASPRGYQPPSADVTKAKKLGAATGSVIRIVEDPAEAAKDADCIITDAFVSMGFESEREKRTSAFLPRYRVDERLFSRAKKDAIFMHCLPAHRDEEVTSEVIDGPRSAVMDEAENRLHTSKALLCLMLLGERASESISQTR